MAFFVYMTCCVASGYLVLHLYIEFTSPMTLIIIVEFVRLQLHVCVIVAVVRDQLMVEGKCPCIVSHWQLGILQ